MKSWKRPPELNFVVLNFVAHDIILLLAYNAVHALNAVHARCEFWFRRDSRRKESGYARLEERWSASVSSLAWEATTSTKHELRWCSHT